MKHLDIWVAVRRDGGLDIVKAYRPEPHEYADTYSCMVGPFKTERGAEYLRDNWDKIICHDNIEAIELLAHGGDPAALDALKKLAAARSHWSRQVGAGFSASEVEKVTKTHVTLDDGRSFKLDILNRREIEEVIEGFRSAERKRAEAN